MGIRIHKPTSPGRRIASVDDYKDITASKPVKRLTVALKKHSGRNQYGKITVRHQGGGNRKRYRLVDFHQMQLDKPATVATIEYDPNRTARIALVEYSDKKLAYVLAPDGLQVGDAIVSSQNKVEAKPGNRMPLKHIPAGMDIHNIEFFPGRGGQLVRSAGMRAILMSHEGNRVSVKLPSGEIRLFSPECFASIGMMSNPDNRNVRLGKAGRMRHLGIRPRVRGKAMNPVDHPHGGGEGNTSIGLKKGPKTPWGKKAMGVKTRRKGKKSDQFIMQRRKK